ncbi:beta-galactosidase trimerization domain-containing protein [candidate division KSB1 bacterium]|nr:beta-galactosidase trimerization domain-containing protein [candidate division KSB1 bacterium]
MKNFELSVSQIEVLFFLGFLVFWTVILTQPNPARANAKKSAATQADIPWYQRPMRIAALQCNYENGQNLAVIDKWHDMGFNVEQLFHPMADDYSALYDPALHQKILTDYLAKAKANQLRIILYLNVHILGPALMKYQETWAQRDPKNQIVMLYDTYPAVCINSPWREHFFKVLDDLAEFDLDGVFLDGPLVNAQGCHCEACKARYQEWFGKPYPDHVSSFEFNQRTRDDFLTAAYHRWKQLKPEAIFYINLPVMHATPLFVDIEKALTYNDLLGSEGGFMFYQPPKNAFLWRPSFTAKLLEAISSEKPRIIFMAGDQKPWSWYLHAPAETQLCIASCVANAANVWWGIHGSTKLLPTRSGQTAREMFRFLAQNETYFDHSTPVARVGLLYSYTSERVYHSSYEASDFSGAQKKLPPMKGDLTASLYGMYEMLVRSQIPFSLVTDFDAALPQYRQFDCLILPSTGALSDQTVLALREYVRQGGNLIASFDGSLIDTQGRLWEDFALADVFGVSYGGDYFTLANHNYFTPTDSTHWLFANTQIPLYPAPLLGLTVTPHPDAEVLARYLAPLRGRYVPLTSPQHPALIYHRFGQGQCLFLAGAFGKMFNEYNPPEYRRLLANAVNRFSKPLIQIEKISTSALEITLRQQDQRLLLHLVNYSGDMTRPIENVQSLRNLQVKLSVPGKWRQARGLVSQQTYPLKVNAGAVEFVLPELGIYEVVVFE